MFRLQYRRNAGEWTVLEAHDFPYPEGDDAETPLRVGEILGSWVRGNVYTRNDGVKVYGFIYDAGSHGGAGMNRFGEIELSRP